MHKETPLTRLFGKLAQDQTRRPFLHLVLALVVTAISLPIALRLSMNGDFSALLPESAESVVDLRQMVNKFGVASTLTVAVEAPERATVIEATKELAAELKSVKNDEIISVDSGVADFIAFVEKNKHLYADKDFLQKFQEDLHARIEFDVAKESPMSLGLTDGLGLDEPPTLEDLKKRLVEEADRKRSASNKYEQGLFIHEKIPVAMIFLRTKLEHGRALEAGRLTDSVEAAFSRVKAKNPKLAPAHIEFGGDLMDAAYETKMLATQMAVATIVTLLLVMGSVVLFFRSWRSVPILALGLVPPISATFAFAYLSVTFLNTSTAFLMSIVIGNGINPMIIWLGRYFEERSTGLETGQALAKTHIASWEATLVASLAASLAYGSLAVTHFRGFRDFGIIGGVAMVLCWLSTFLVLPPLTVLFERFRPLKTKQGNDTNPYGRAFVWLAFKSPRAAVLGTAVLSLISLVLVGIAISKNPIEYDFRNLSSKRDPTVRIEWVNRRQGEIVSETVTGSAVAILAPKREDVPKLVADLESYSQKNPGILGPVRSIESLLPADQEAKLPIVAALRADLVRALKFLPDDQKAELEKQIPPSDLRPLTDADLPDDIARTFTEKDGTRGRLMFSEHHQSKNGWDGAYWIEWTKGVRSARASDGSRPPSTGHAMVFSDILARLAVDGPIAIAGALAATVVLLFVSLKRMRDRYLTLAALFGGVLWMAAMLAILRIKLNFLNVLAFPITLGIGVDYGINVIKRYIADEETYGDKLAAIRNTVEQTGGAVVLCSLTTIIGYASLHISSNLALQSFGAAMAISEVTCVFLAVVALPAWIALRLPKESKADSMRAQDAAE